MAKIGKIKYFTLHCSATQPSHDLDIATIREWHLARAWKDVGYHYFIKRNGEIQEGRSDGERGAHVANHNTGNIGICLAGGIAEGGDPSDPSTFEDNVTDSQWYSLSILLSDLYARFPNAEIKGHNWFDQNKGCPVFNWQDFAERFEDHRKNGKDLYIRASALPKEEPEDEGDEESETPEPTISLDDMIEKEFSSGEITKQKTTEKKEGFWSRLKGLFGF